MSTRPAAPLRDPLVDPKTGMVTGIRWPTYLRDMRTDLDAAPTALIPPVQLTNQGAAISTTAFPTESLAAGIYRVTVYQRITTAAGVSSSLQTTISWTDGAIACSVSGAALTGNTTATIGSFTALMHIDGATPISYTTAYASDLPGVMRYRLDLVLELIAEDA